MKESTEKMRKRRGGRRAMLPEERRLYSVKPGFTEHEIDLLEARAEAIGLPVAEYLRRLAIGQPTIAVPPINREVVAELNRIGTNINQATRLMNRRLDDLEQNEFRSELLALRKKLDDVTSIMLGVKNGNQQSNQGF